MNEVTLSQGEKLILLMLCDIHTHLKIQGGVDADLISEAIYSGHLWGLAYHSHGVFGPKEIPDTHVRETGHILSMWQRLEQSYDNLDASQTASVDAEIKSAGGRIKFPGFDGNTESEHLGIARFLIDNLEDFSQFKGRSLDSHLPLSLDRYRRMLPAYDAILKERSNLDFTPEQIIEVISARVKT